jgi:integrase
MTKKRSHGDGGIDRRGENSFRLRYRVRGERHTVTFHGSLSEARAELRRLLSTRDDGTHVAPARTTLADWVAEWLELRQRSVSTKTAEHYAMLLQVHVLPVLGERALQDIEVAEIDRLYGRLAEQLSPRSVRHVHVILKACLKTAVAKRRLFDNPAARADTPKAKESDAWNVLDADKLNALVSGFKHTALYGIVAVAAFTGMRRNEILALRWSDIDFVRSTIRVARSLEETKAKGRTVKEPKTERGKRSIALDAWLLELLRAEHRQHLAIIAGTDSPQVSLGLVRLPPDALVFPSLAQPFDFTRLRGPVSVTKAFTKHADALGFPIRLHDLRHSHGTILLAKGVPIHEVAGRLRSYRRTPAPNLCASFAEGGPTQRRDHQRHDPRSDIVGSKLGSKGA